MSIAELLSPAQRDIAVNLAYLISSILFVVGLKGLSSKDRGERQPHRRPRNAPGHRRHAL